ncbi:MAG: TolC family protein [Thermodesulfobacteriota bacterium]|jgi:cobalt-zinc-cadmium efflux system outer membrane protein
MITFFSNVVPVKGEELNLEQALELFYENNYDILINKYETDKAYAEYVGAKLIPNPTLSLNAIGLDYYDGYPKRADETQVIARVDQLIELGGKRKLRTESALAGHEVAALSHRDVIRNLLIGFYTVYYNLHLDGLNIEFARGELGRFDHILDIAERRFNAGFLSLLDYTKIKLAKIDLENNLTNFETQFKKDLENFNFLIGGDRNYRPSRLVVREVFPEFSEENLVEAGLKNRYDLLALQKQAEVARHNLALAKALRIPDLSVGVEHDSFGKDSVSRIGGGVSIGLPIFNRAQGEILKRSTESKQVEQQIKKVRRLVISDVRQALLTYQSSLKVFDAYKTRKTAMEDLLNKSESAFSLGGITVLDLLDTRRTYRDFITKYNQTLVQALLNQELIKVYTGEFR